MSSEKTLNKTDILKLTIGSFLACVYRVMEARGKFGVHERSVIYSSDEKFSSGLLAQLEFLHALQVVFQFIKHSFCARDR